MNQKPMFEPELVFWDLKGESASECLNFLGNALIKAGKARESYTQAVLKREDIYPTGLQTPSMPIAIPHANPEDAIENAFAIAKLEHPVIFHQMADEDQEVPVELIFMMCIAKPQEQAPVLSKILELFSDSMLKDEIYACESADALYELLRGKMEREEKAI